MSNRFRAYDKMSNEIMKMEDDYTFRSNDGRLILNLTEAFQLSRILTIQENTRSKDMRGMDIFEGDKVRFNVRGDSKMANGVVVRRESGTWVVRAENGLEYLMDDVFAMSEKEEVNNDRTNQRTNHGTGN